MYRKSRSAMAVTVALFSSVVAVTVEASSIVGWNQANVVTDVGPYVDGTTYSSNIYDGAGTTNGKIVFEPPEGTAPGMTVMNDVATSPAVENCIMASSGATPPTDCNGAFQSGKRFKLNRTAFEPIDLVFDVNPDGTFAAGNSGTYKVFEKYGNDTGESISSFTVELGFGIGSDFVLSTAGDGLAFVDASMGGTVTPKPNEFSSYFPAGLFGPVDEPKHPIAGYFDNTNRAGFNLDLLSEDIIASAGMFGSYETLFGDWMSFGQAPDGYFYDDDGDPLTDNVLMAHFDEVSGKWIMNRDIDAAGNVVIIAEGNNGTVLADVSAVEAALTDSFAMLDCLDPAYVAGDPCLAGTGVIEDLAKFNLTYFLDFIDFTSPSAGPFASAGIEASAFTLRITATPSAVPVAGALPLLAIGLLGMMAGMRRRS